MRDLHYETLQHIPNHANETLPLFSLDLIISDCRIDENEYKLLLTTTDYNRILFSIQFKMNQNKIIYT